MNFLSHFYFDRHSPDPDLVLGGVLPDLVKNANKSWNLHPERKADRFSIHPKLRSLLSGWKRHLAVDRYFHNSSFFNQHTSEIRKSIAPVLQSSPVRPSFVAHIALELMLDSLLLTREIINAHDFYDHLKRSDRHSVTHFLELNDLRDTRLFLDFFDTFLEVNYLHSYRESHNIMYALNRICMRIWHDPLNSTQKLQLTDVLLDYQQHLQTNFMEIFDDIDKHLNDYD